MMNFLDLSATSEEERRLIREILSDTSVVNFTAEPVDSKSSKSKNDGTHLIETNSQPQQTSSVQNFMQNTQSPPSTSLSSATTSTPSTTANTPTTHRYNIINPTTIPPPPHVTAFGPAPPHVYGGTPIFQPYYHLIPYNISPYVPYVMPPNPVVPSRHQVPPITNQLPNNTNSYSRNHSQHHIAHHHPQAQQQHSQLQRQQHPHHPHQHQQHHHHQTQHQHQPQDIKSEHHHRSIDNSQHHPLNSKVEAQLLKQQPEQLIYDSTRLELDQNSKVDDGDKKSVELEKESNVSKPTTNSTSQLHNDNRLTQQSKPNRLKKATREADAIITDDNLNLETKHQGPQERIASLNNDSKSLARSSNDLKLNNSLRNETLNHSETKNSVPNQRLDRLETQPSHLPSNTESTNNQQNQPETTPQIRNDTNNKRNIDNNIIKASDSRQPSATTGPPVPAKNADVEDPIKLSSDEGFETQSSLDVSKQSHESSSRTSDNSKSSPETCNRTVVIDRLRTEAPATEKITSVDSQKGAWGSASSKSWASLFKREGNGLSGSYMNGEVEQNNVSEFENSDEENNHQRPIKTDSNIVNLSAISREQRSQGAAKFAQDKTAPRLAQKMNAINLKHALPFLKPRGFINKGNGCYINATLQALIACPPFYNLMREIGDLRKFHRENSCTPILDGFAELFLSFPPLDINKKIGQSNTQDQKMQINNIQAEPIEPKCIYNVLGQIKSECLKGAQEDAEEFLSSVLNGLHEEMIGLSETLQESSNQNGHVSDVDDSADDIANDDNLWREVGPKNRSLPIRTARVINTPIQEIFGGSLFSIRTAGKDRCGHRSPFFDLQLDISGDNVRNVHDAIMSFTAPETIHDFYCSKTKQKLDAQRRTSLDQLPPILILHLKQFVYTQNHGLKKLMKKIEYPIDFELPESSLHEKNSNDKNRISRSYKLLAVVYHDGKEAIKGHYLTDVFHIGSSQWLRCDDSNLKVIPAPRIETPDSFRTPYLLFYRRLNTLRAATGAHNKKKA